MAFFQLEILSCLIKLWYNDAWDILETASSDDLKYLSCSVRKFAKKLIALSGKRCADASGTNTFANDSIGKGL